jgi:hypothetical protein
LVPAARSAVSSVASACRHRYRLRAKATAIHYQDHKSAPPSRNPAPASRRSSRSANEDMVTHDRSDCSCA